MTIRTFLRGYRLEKLQGMTAQDYVLPTAAHGEYPNIELPDFLSQEFFSELQGKVIAIFDAMLDEADLGATPVAAG